MSHFYLSARGSRGEVTRTGTRSSGVTAHVRSWTHGVRAEMHEAPDGEDYAFIEITSGSAQDGRTSHVYITNGQLDAILDGRARLAVRPREDE